MAKYVLFPERFLWPYGPLIKGNELEEVTVKKKT